MSRDAFVRYARLRAYPVWAGGHCARRGFERPSLAAAMSAWLVWFAYYSEQANVGIVEAESPEDACQKFWQQHGDPDTWPCRGVHALPAVPGQAVEINAEH